MCKENRDFFIILLVTLLLVSVLGALRGEEQDQWYLISEPELRNIEKYKATSEAEKQTWQLQAGELRMQAERLSARAAILQAESATLNNQLSAAREAQRRSEELFERSEVERLTQLSLKNGEIATLAQIKADKTTQIEKYKGQSSRRLIIAAALGLAWVIFIAFKIYRKFRPFF
jgi:hypothetical protein